MNERPPSRLGSLVPPAGWLDDDGADAEGVGAGFLFLVTLVALALRLFSLDGMSLWVDEVFTWELVTPRPGAEFWPHILAAYQGPLYHAAAWPLVRLADTAFMLRLPAALAGTFTVTLLGIFAGRLWGRGAGRLAAVLACVAPFLIWYSQEARGYAFVMFFATASGMVLMNAVRHGLGSGRALGLALLIGAGLMSNFSFIFLVIAYGLSVLLVARPRRAGEWLAWSLALGGGVVLALPWLLEAAGIWEVARVVPGADTGEALRGETTFSPWALPFTGFALLYGFTLGPSLAELHAPDRLAVLGEHVPVLAVAALAALVPLLFSLLQLGRRRWLLVLWLLIPVLGVVLLATRNVKPFNVRYLATIWPWLLLLLAAGAMRMAVWPRRLCVGAVLALCLASLGGLFFMGDYAKADVRGAVAAMVTAGAEAGDPVLVPTVGPVVRRYFPAADVRGCWDEAPLADAAMADALVARQLAGRNDAWYIRARSWDLDPQGLLPAALSRAGSLERLYEGANVSVDRWRRHRDRGESGS